MRTGCTRRRGFASSHIKLLIAAGLAGAGVLLAVRGAMPTRSEQSDREKPRIVTADGSAPTPQRSGRRAPEPADVGWTSGAPGTTYDFQRVSNAADARNLADAIGRAIDTSGDASNGLGGDLVGLLAPSIAGEGTVRDAVVALGGEDNGGIRVLDALLQTVLKHASADPAAITISTPDEQPKPLGNMSISRNRSTGVDDEGNEVDQDLISLTSSFERTFPDALDDDATGRLRLVEIPMRSKDAKGDEADIRLAITLRYSTAAQAWQPAAMTIDSTDTGVVARVVAAIRGVAGTTEEGGTNNDEGGN